ncbi:PIN domain-containing protein [Candidatus Daviesbacteria bacterium]|nr:PIN domain-containing protein [Candidatus Daviesbacteria bacterium]
MVVLDTNIIIDHLRQEDKLTYLVNFRQKFSNEKLAISVISIQELYEGQSSKDKERHRKLIKTISSLRILPYTYEVAKFAGEIARDTGAQISLADAAIAATAIINEAQLLTLNIKDFEKIKGLKFASV